MEIDPNAALQSQFLVARNVMASGLVKETYADGKVDLTIASAALTRSAPAVEVPTALVETEAAAPPEDAARQVAAVTVPAAALANAVRQADALMDPAAAQAAAPAAAPATLAAAQAGATPAVLRHALIGLMTDLEAHDNSAAAQQKLHEDAQRIIVAATQTFADMTKRNALIEVLRVVVKELEKRMEHSPALSTEEPDETPEEAPPEEPAEEEAEHPVDAAIKQIYADAAHAYTSHAEVPFRI